MSEITHINRRQLAAARTLAGLGQVDLAKAANISAPTLRRMEAEKEQLKVTNNVRAVIRVLEAAGIQFLDDGDTAAGSGVALRGGA